MSGTLPQPRYDRSGNFLVPLRPLQAPLAQIHRRATPTPSEGQVTKMSATFPQPRRDRGGNLLVPLQAPRAAPSPSESQVTNISGTFPQPRRAVPQLPLQAPLAHISCHRAPSRKFKKYQE